MDNKYCMTLIHAKGMYVSDKDRAYKDYYVNYDDVKMSPGERNTYTRKTQEAFSDPKKAKAYANRMWYLKNKQWKKDYNRAYYEANRDYWERRYREALAENKNVHAQAEAYKKEQNAIVDDWNKSVDKWNSTAGSTYGQVQRQSRIEDTSGLTMASDVKLAAIKDNMERARKDYTWFLDNNKKMTVKEAWSDGAKQIRDAGKKFVSNLRSRFGF